MKKGTGENIITWRKEWKNKKRNRREMAIQDINHYSDGNNHT